MKIRRLHYPNGLRGKLLKLTGPIFLETLLILTLGVVDTLMLSHYSDNAVAAAGVVNQLLNMVFLLFNVTESEHRSCVPYILAQKTPRVLHR